MFDADTTRFLESGCAVLVGTVGPDGEPHACRGWGVTVADAEAMRVRLVLPDDARTIENLEDHGSVAITGADPRTFRSMQIKGHATGFEEPGPDDLAHVEHYCDEFFTAVVDTDGTNRALLESMRPASYTICLVDIEDLFDQTPGPEAGGALPGSSA